MRQGFRLDRMVQAAYLGLGLLACNKKAPVLVPHTAPAASEAQVLEWTQAVTPSGSALHRFKWLYQEERKSTGGRGSARIAAPDSLRFDVAGPLGAGHIQAVVLGDSALWVVPERTLQDLIPDYWLLWAMLGVARRPPEGATLRGASSADGFAWEYALGSDTVEYLRTTGKTPTLHARVRRAGKTIGRSETTLGADGQPLKAKLLVPSVPAKLDLTFYENAPTAAFPPQTWVPPKR